MKGAFNYEWRRFSDLPAVVFCVVSRADSQLTNGGETGHVQFNVAEVSKDLTYVLSISFCLIVCPFLIEAEYRCCG